MIKSSHLPPARGRTTEFRNRMAAIPTMGEIPFPDQRALEAQFAAMAIAA